MTPSMTTNSVSAVHVKIPVFCQACIQAKVTKFIICLSTRYQGSRRFPKRFRPDSLVDKVVKLRLQLRLTVDKGFISSGSEAAPLLA